MDSSVAIPALLSAHPSNSAALAALRGRRPVLTGHSSAETYSTLTRLRGTAISPDLVARSMASQFGAPALLPPGIAQQLPEVLAAAGVQGGAVYDALVGLAAREAGLPLVTRDGRALATYAALGVRVELIPS